MKKHLSAWLAAAIMLFMVSCASSQKSNGSNEADLFKSWRATGFDTTGAEHSPTIAFDQAQNRVSGNGSCNRYSGGYTLTAPDKIAFSPLASTKMACPGLNVESRYLELLNKANKWSIKDGVLTLSQDGTVLLTFVAE
ncbi:META domain-containing protein [Chitinophaga sp. SYP-B3965]|uniref:META domain-containing protein n=1 Tax=Chitinophaga sp. SYP-B3965 TaxID=2663120 RepID=UPI001299782B|nr:META domain-containing protein [Chitinophaga sp. SYP-B3965]MRG44297.1 META domain-containing protein [Chitinophaga sp. SYP-B3965]